MSAEVILFWALAACTVASALGVVLARSPMNSAMALVATFFFLAGIYVLLWAHTIAVIQVLVYAGAIMVLFLFVIMLLSMTEPEAKVKFTASKVAGIAAAAALCAALIAVLSRLPPMTQAWTGDPAKVASFGTLQKVGEIIFTAYLLPFEAVSLLLLAAIVGAVVVAKPRI
ncbi:MAG: NADH-quinone oxidoreductase subunit J family protein [Myxococcaceae bacterium]